MVRIAVTGASGFVGSSVVRLLQDEHHEVQALVGPGTFTSSIYGLDVTSGDIRDLEAVRRVVAGSEVVIHLADRLSHASQAVDVVTTGTRNVVTAAQEADVGHLVYMSCLGSNTAGPPFQAAKWEAEMMVEGSSLPFTILRSSLIIGPDAEFVRSLSHLIDTLPAIPVPGKGNERQQPIDVEDVARCVLIVVQREDMRNRTVSIGGDTFVSFRQLVDILAGTLGVNKPKLLVPTRLVVSLASVLPRSARSVYDPARMAQFHEGVVASPGILQREFGFQPQSVVQKLRQV